MTFTRRELLRSTGLLAGGSMLAADAAVNPAAPVTGTVPHVAATVMPADLFDYAKLAPSHMTAIGWEYISGGAADELTLRWNRESYDRIRLRPRILVDVSQIDMRVTLFGRELPFPILLAPTAYHKLAHGEGEIATAKGAGAAGATFVVSTSATSTLEDIAQVATKPLWFQLYVQPDREFTRELVRRAETTGCQALVV